MEVLDIFDVLSWLAFCFEMFECQFSSGSMTVMGKCSDMGKSTCSGVSRGLLSSETWRSHLSSENLLANFNDEMLQAIPIQPVPIQL